jgi:hypothetical protein
MIALRFHVFSLASELLTAAYRTPDDIAGLVSFIVSKESQFITGDKFLLGAPALSLLNNVLCCIEGQSVRYLSSQLDC